MDVIILWKPAPHFREEQLPSLRVVVLQVVEHRGQALTAWIKGFGVYVHRLSNGRRIESISSHPAKPVKYAAGLVGRYGTFILMAEFPAYLSVRNPPECTNDKILKTDA